MLFRLLTAYSLTEGDIMFGSNMLVPGSGTNRRYGLVGGSLSLWEWALRPSF